MHAKHQGRSARCVRSAQVHDSRCGTDVTPAPMMSAFTADAVCGFRRTCGDGCFPLSEGSAPVEVPASGPQCPSGPPRRSESSGVVWTRAVQIGVRHTAQPATAETSAPPGPRSSVVPACAFWPAWRAPGRRTRRRAARVWACSCSGRPPARAVGCGAPVRGSCRHLAALPAEVDDVPRASPGR
jgi:hypothetical protein